MLELAARAPERVERAVLLDPAVWVPPPIALEYAEEARYDPSFGSVEEAVADALAHNEAAPPEALEEDMREHLARSADGRYRFRRCASAVVTAFSELAQPPPPLEEIAVPTLVVRGAHSEVVPDVLVEILVEAMRDRLQVVTVRGGHNVLWDAFDETADAVENFLGA